jgi:hypothetical protein
MGRHDQYVEVVVSYTLPEAESEITWDVRIRTNTAGAWRLYVMDTNDIAEVIHAVPGLRAVESILERWLEGVGVQMELPFA